MLMRQSLLSRRKPLLASILTSSTVEIHERGFFGATSLYFIITIVNATQVNATQAIAGLYNEELSVQQQRFKVKRALQHLHLRQQQESDP